MYDGRTLGETMRNHFAIYTTQSCEMAREEITYSGFSSN